MNKILLSLLATASIVSAVPAAAQTWQNINERQAQLDQRIDAGVRSGQLTAIEAQRLRAEFGQLARVESDYRRDGLTAEERADLDRRFDRLAQHVRNERRDDQQADGNGRWQSLNERQGQLEQRIDAGVRSGQLTAIEAQRLRAEFEQLARVESSYRRDGLTAEERADLDRRFDRLAQHVRNERRDDQDARDDTRWQTINERQARLDQRIDAGIRTGQLTRGEAIRLRGEFQQIARLENNYRRNGLTAAERADLDRRFDRLAQQIGNQRQDGQRADGRWENLNQRQAQFRQRLNTAVQDRRLTQRQAANLAAEFRSIADLEQRYRQGGLSMRERADLNQRFDRLQANFRSSVAANQYGYGYGQAPNLFDYLFGIR